MWWVSAALAAELSGTLLGADGTPVVGATVLAYDSRFAYGMAVTRSGGEWSIVGLPADRYRVRFLPPNYDPHGDRFLGGAWDVCDTDPVAVAEDEVRAGLDQALQVGAVVTGRVLDVAGNPMPEVQVTVYGAEPRTALVARTDATDVDGSFRVEGLDAEATGSAFYVLFEVSGWPEQWLGPVYAEGNSTRITAAAATVSELDDARLLDGIRVVGTISGPDGPVAAGTVYTYAEQQVLGVGIAADGTYDADGLPPGDVVVWAQSEGLATTYWPDADRPSGVVTVEEEGAEATIDLTLPVESVLTLHAEGEVSEVGATLYNDTYTVGRGDGFDTSGKVVFPGLWPGEYFLYISGSKAGFENGFLLDDDGERRTFPLDGLQVVEVELPRGATLSGTVTDDAGGAVYGAQLVFSEFGVEAPRTWSTTSSRDGGWTLPGVAGVTGTLSASYASYCPNDRGWTSAWYPEGRDASGAVPLALDAGDSLADLDLVLAADDDHDGMGDAWERTEGLDPGRDDGAEDADGDGYTNAEEWVLGTDPTSPAAVGECGGGCGEGGVGALIVAVVAGLRRHLLQRGRSRGLAAAASRRLDGCRSATEGAAGGVAGIEDAPRAEGHPLPAGE